MYDSRGDYRKAIEFYQHGLTITKEVGDKETVKRAYWNLGGAYSSLYDSQKQSSSIRRMSVSQKRLEIKNQKKWVTTCLVVCTVTSLGDFRKAIDFFQQGLAIAKEVGDKESEGRAYGNLGIAYNYLYDVSKAVDFHQKKVSIEKLIGDRLSEGEEYLNLGELY